ncbi:hypothetical protein [Janibacter sp. LM]|uniref:hypothetical protein n=1 Tax=Janibacter sp. LM TaxID=3144845 RepID=UPI0031F7064E
MSSIWLVVSGSDVPVDGEGFHITEAAAKSRVAEKLAEDRAAYDRAKTWFEVSFDEFRAVRGMPSSYGVLEVEDVELEIHHGGSVPDAIWVLIEGEQVGVDHGWVTREGVEELLLDHNIAAHEYWEVSTERAEGMSFIDFHKNGWRSRVLCIARNDGRSIERPGATVLSIE